MVPTVNLQVERGGGTQKDLRAKMLFSSPPGLTMPLKRVRGNRKKKQQQCYCCYIGRHRDSYKPNFRQSLFVLPSDYLQFATSHICFDKPVCFASIEIKGFLSKLDSFENKSVYIYSL